MQVAASLGGGLAVAVMLPGCGAGLRDEAGQFAPNGWIRISSDNRIRLLVDRSEMGQGVMTALPMLLAEELEVDLHLVEIEFAPAAPEYKNPLFMLQATGGSTSVKAAYKPLRRAGAIARALLVTAAAKRWSISTKQCQATNGVVKNLTDGKHLTYGELASDAAQMTIQRVSLKSPDQFRYLGHAVDRLDNEVKVNGSAIFGIDVLVPDALTAVVIQPPVFGAKLRDFDAAKVLALEGVQEVVTISHGVAVVADSYWQARQAASQVTVEWHTYGRDELNSETIFTRFKQLAQTPGRYVSDRGNAQQIIDSADRTISAEYQLPYLAHATMEPMNCTAHVQAHRCDVWAPTQGQGNSQQIAAKITGLKRQQVFVHTTFLGGGFGRRIAQDYVQQAVEISQQVERPVKVVWSREDDMQHDYYRPATYSVLSAALDADGQPKAWFHRLVGPSILQQALPEFIAPMLPETTPEFLSALVTDGGAKIAGRLPEPTAVEGAHRVVYDIPHARVEFHAYDPGIPIGFWRSVGNSHTAFVVESFIDELAHQSQQDPYHYRRALLTHQPRRLKVLDLAATQAGWGDVLAKGHFQGIAQHDCFGSYVAQVAEVSVSDDGEVSVHKVVCAIDCGQVINPDIVAAQMEGGIVYGLTAALKGEITIENGAVAQSNFHDYPLLRMHEMPEIEVYIVPSQEPPEGVGEPGTPPIAPAVTNALFRATGKRVRQLPIRPEYLISASQ